MALQQEHDTMNEDIGVRARATLSTLAEVCHPDWLAGFATHEKDLEALLKKHSNVVGEEMQRKLVEKGKMLDQKAEEVAKVRKELSDYAQELNLGLDAKRLPPDELVTVDVRGQDITTAFKHWIKSPVMEMVIQASRKGQTKPFLDKDPGMVLRVVEYSSSDESISFDDWYDDEVLSRHYANYLGLTKPNQNKTTKKTKKRKVETAAGPNWRRVKAPYGAPTIRDHRMTFSGEHEGYEVRVDGDLSRILFDDNDVGIAPTNLVTYLK